MDNKVAKGDTFYLNPNNFKKTEKGPDLTGKLMLNIDQLHALIRIYEEAQQSGVQPVLQIDVAGWNGTSKKDGKPYVYCKSEVYFGPSKEKQSGGYNKSYSQNQQDDW